MRIGLITPGFSASEDDWCIPALLDLVRGLARRDDVTVFTLRYPHHRRPYPVYGASVVPFGGAQRRGAGRLPLLLRALWRIVRAARRRPFDVFHALWAHEPGFLAVAAGRLTGTPVMVSLLGGELVDLPEVDYGGQRSRVNLWLTRRALAGARRVSVGSRSLRRLAKPHVAPGKLVRQPLGVDRHRFATGRKRPRPSPSGVRLGGDPRLLHVGSLVPVKDQTTLLRAFAGLGRQHRRAHLHLVGEGPLRSRLEDLARQLAVADRLTFHGAVSHDRLADFYRQADLLVVSSHFESQGMAMLEAAACGCPVVGTAVGVLPELGPQRGLCTPGDPQALARLLDATLRDPAGRADLRTAQATALEGFELNTTLDGWRRLYRTVALQADREATGRESTG